MIQEIIKKYDRFPDALILEINFKSITATLFKGDVAVTLRCKNHQADFKWEVVRLTFSEVVSFRFIEHIDASSVIVYAAMIQESEGIITFDFFPLMYGAFDLRENKDSDFMIKSRSVSYEVLGTIG